jgi:hypothetical protein
MKISFEWVIRKLEGEEYFSAIMVSKHPNGKKSSIYKLDSLEETFARSERDLTEHLSDAEGYAIAYDAWLVKDGEQITAVACRVEELGMKSQCEFALIYDIQEEQDGITITPSNNLIFMGTTGKTALSRLE